jgi:hypothetical protein
MEIARLMDFDELREEMFEILRRRGPDAMRAGAIKLVRGIDELQGGLSKEIERLRRPWGGAESDDG